MMTDARGKLGGQVFSKNRAGAYVRTKVTPVNPRTSFQMANRAILGNLYASWSGLTDEQRTKWNSAVEDWKKTDIFGDLKTPTGKNLYTSLNKVNAQVGNSPLAEPPAKVEFPIIELSEAYLAVENGVITKGTITTIGNSTDFKIIISATPALSQGTSFVKNRMRNVFVISGGIDVAMNWYEEYSDRFGSALEVGANVWLEMRLVADTGQVSPPQKFKVDVKQQE